MSDKIAIWMDSTAAKLRGNGPDTIDVETLLKSFGIDAYLDRDEKRSGILTQGKDGKWLMIIRGRGDKTKWSPSDRFTAAHELGHYFLMNQWGVSPSHSNKREYYHCENLCNRFAARLLVDYRKVELTKIASPQECLGWVRCISESYYVSKEVAARAIVETHVGLGICGYNKTLLGWHRLWGLASLNGVRKSNRKPSRTKSVKEEMIAWGYKQMGVKQTSVRFHFATESIAPLHISDLNANSKESLATKAESSSFTMSGRIELAALMVADDKPPVNE